MGIDFSDIDGIRASSKDGWWLIRASNTQPVLVARCEASSEEKLQKMKEDLSNLLLEFNLRIS